MTHVDDSYPRRAGSCFQRLWGPLLLIALVTVAIYSNIYHSPFSFDGRWQIVDNATIRDPGNYLSPGALLTPRPLVGLTFALNYRFGKLNVFGYHIVNVLIHMVNGFLVYFLALAIFKQLLIPAAQRFGHSNSPKSKVQSYRSQVDPKLGTRNIEPKTSEMVLNTFQSTIDNQQSAIRLMSLFAALIFVAHPLQTQAVTYTIQRYTSMAAMFYFLSVFFYIKARLIQQGAGRRAGTTGEESPDRTLIAYRLPLSSYFASAVLCGMLAFLSKQNTLSLPGAILLAEYLLFDRTWQGWKRKLIWMVPVFALFACFALYVSGVFRGGVQFGDLLEDISVLMRAGSVDRWTYLCTQFNVVTVYVRLLFLPIGQSLDYLYAFNKGFFDGYTPLAFLFLMGIVALGIWSVKKRPLITFGIFWFFITLSVESTIIPISDALVEHRLYLPMFGFALVVPYVIFSFFSRKRTWAIAISVLCIVVLGTATYLRNMVWQERETLWADAVSKNQQNERALYNLGTVLAFQGKMAESVGYFTEALRLKPGFSRAHSNLGNSLMHVGKLDESIPHLREALRLKPDFVEAHYNMGLALMQQDKLDEAAGHMTEALRLRPEYADARHGLGKVRMRQGRINDAARCFEAALKLKPESADVHYSLGSALGDRGDIAGAIEQLGEVVRIQPDNATARNELGIYLMESGRPGDAAVHFAEALLISPETPELHYNLGNALAGQEKLEDAASRFTEALRINPDYLDAHINLGVVLARQGKPEEGLTHMNEALRISPDNETARNYQRRLIWELRKRDHGIPGDATSSQ